MTARRFAAPIRVRVTVKSRSTIAHEIDVPAEVHGAEDLLPALRRLDDAIIDRERRRIESEGRNISCRPGCGACCRQLVPLTPPEVGGVRERARRDERLGQRFAAASVKLAEAGVLEDVRAAPALEPIARKRTSARYFELGIPCPFLEEERCSIYDERPLACREYVVSSPADECARMGAVTREPIAGRLLPRVLAAEQGRWVPLILAPDSDGIPVDRRDISTTGPDELASVLASP